MAGVISTFVSEWAFPLSAVGGAVTFWWKLNADSKTARYRETIAFIDKRNEKLKVDWKGVRTGDENAEEFAHDLFAQLEMVAHLVLEGVFDEELVYTSWWMYFDHPLQDATVNNWIALERVRDPEILSCYLKLCEKWAPRLDREQSR